MFDRLRFYKGVLAQDMEKIAIAHWEQFETLRDTLKPVCGEIRGKTILDVGCGRLFPYSMILHNLGNKVVGIDISCIPVNMLTLKKYWAVLRQDGLASFTREFLYAVLGKDKKYFRAMRALSGMPFSTDGIDIRRMNAERLDFPDETFDLAVSNATFEHIHDVPSAVAEMARVLKKGGIAYIGINLFTSLAGGYFYDYDDPSKVKPWGHLRGNGHTAPVYLNKVRESEFVRLFRERLEVLMVKNIGVGEGRGLLTPQVKEELEAYSEDELLKRDIVIVARKE